MTRPPNPLLAMLERDFADPARALGGAARDVPLELWRQALLAPAREFLQRPGKEFRGRLVAAAWALSGGAAGGLPSELPLVIEILHAGSLIVDDIHDQSESRRGRPALHHLYGVPLALNTGNWLYFWSLVVLGRNLPEPVAAAAWMRASTALMRCHQGQALDLATRVFDLAPDAVGAAVATATGLKTGTLMSLAAELGALAAGAAPDVRAKLAQFGEQLGVGLQMLDDLGGLLAPVRQHKGIEDLCHARLTWPWAWLAELDRAALTALQARARELHARCHAAAAPCDAAGEAADIARDIAAVVADTGRARVAEHLASTLAELAAGLGRSGPLIALEAEITRLMESYG